jgi:hypothetical protein
VPAGAVDSLAEVSAVDSEARRLAETLLGRG